MSLRKNKTREIGQKTETAGIRVTGIKIKQGEDIGQRLQQCRRYFKIPQSRLGINSTFSGVETGRYNTIRMETIEKYLKVLFLNKITFYFQEEGIKTETSFEEIGTTLKGIRNRRKYAARAFQSVSYQTIYNIESDNRNCYLISYLEYAKELGIKELIIHV